MDVLDKYKESWKNQPDETNKVSKVDIYKMSHKKSTSIVKWIFIIGIAEFVLSICSSLFLSFSETNFMGFDKELVKWAKFTFSVLLHTITLYFIFHFYKNYKSISSSEDTKTLMSKIVKTRKTVKKFIQFNFILFFISAFMLISGSIYSINKNEETPFLLIVPLVIILGGVFLFGFYLLKFYYHLLYGRLLDKLYYNHKELSKLETE